MREMMIDLETWSTEIDAEIRSIGAVSFGFNKDIHPEFLVATELYANIAPQYERGRLQSTVDWWRDQSAEAQAVFDTQPRIELKWALMMLVSRYEASGCERIWSHGAGFDIPIIEHAMKAYGIKIPWKYSQHRDTRTLFEEWGVDASYQWPGYTTKHHALHDAYNQARAVITCKFMRSRWAA